MADIMHQLRIHAPPSRVFQAITTAEEIRNWWTRDATIEPKVGAKGEFGFYGRRLIAEIEVAELQPPFSVKWRVTNRAWHGKDIEFGLSADGNDPVLTFAHRGFQQADDGYASATTRWGYYLVSLKRHIEGRRGNPNPEDADAFG